MEWKQACILSRATVKETMEHIDRTSLQFAAVVDSNMQLLGTVTDGDIRRAILKGVSLEESIQTVMNEQPKTISVDLTIQEQWIAFRRLNLKQVPIVNENRQVIKILFDKESRGIGRKNKVVLMAGGLGTRLHPLTKETPKPMLPVGDKPILELIIEHFKKHGFYDFIISVNYKKEIIQNYFQDGSFLNVNISYIEEERRLGTAGALSLIEEPLGDPFFVMNGDILTNFDCTEMLEQHMENNAVATIGVREYEYQIPYGVITADGIQLKKIEEKPTHKEYVSAGIYILSSDVLRHVPTDEFYDMPTLFEELITYDQQSIVYPIKDYWLDIGKYQDYQDAQKGVEQLNG